MGFKDRNRKRETKRAPASKSSYERILIVTEGEKTEKNYFEEIRREYRLQTTNISVIKARGTEPRQIVDHAIDLAKNGDRSKGIGAKAFESVFAVFDRDEHQTFFDALLRIDQLNATKKIKNDEGEVINFYAGVSIPCFELWLLLHFKEHRGSIHRSVAFREVKNYIKGYEKGFSSSYACTKDNLDQAYEQAKILKAGKNREDAPEPYTDVDILVKKLHELKSQ